MSHRQMVLNVKWTIIEKEDSLTSPHTPEKKPADN